MKMRILAVAALTFALAGCEHLKPEKEIVPVPIEQPKYVPATIVPTDPQPVNWMVLNREGLLELAERVKATGESVTLFILDAEGFRALSLNLVDIRRYLGELNADYEGLLEAHNGAPKKED